MKSIRIIFAIMFVVVCTLLAACGGSVQTPAPNVAETPLITDADIDNAQLLLPTEVKELVGIEGGEAKVEQTLNTLSDAILSQQNTQVGLPQMPSSIHYIQADSTPTNAPDAHNLVPGPMTYRVYRKDTSDFDLPSSMIYSGVREVQSVTATEPTNSHNILVSMRETTDPSSDFEIFLIAQWHEFASVRQLTFDNVDNINVSGTTFSDYRFVYEQTVSGKATLVIGTWSGDQYSTVTLNSPSPQRHPNLSGDSEHIVFVRDLPNSYDSIVKYTIATNTYNLVVDTTPTNARLTPVPLDFPSLSYFGDKVLWLENNRTVKFKNLVSGSVQTVASDPTIKRPHLNDDGIFMTYQQGSNISFKNLQTAQMWSVTSSSRFVSYYGAALGFSYYGSAYRIWSGLQVEIIGIGGLPNGQNRVKLTGPHPHNYINYTFDKNFLTSDIYPTYELTLYPGTYTLTAESFSRRSALPSLCKTYTPTPASQAITLVPDEFGRVSVSYTARIVPCN